MPESSRGHFRSDGKIAVTHGGELFWIDPSELKDALAQGYELPSEASAKKLERADSIGSAVMAHIIGANRTYTAGLSDWLSIKLGEKGLEAPGKVHDTLAGYTLDRLQYEGQPDTRKRLQEYKEMYPTATWLGEVGAYAIPGGIFGKIGKGAKVGIFAGLKGLGLLKNGVTAAKVASSIGGAAAEGAALGLGAASSDIALHHPEMTPDQIRDHLVTSIARGVGTMAVAHTVGLGIGGLRAKWARRAPKDIKAVRELKEIRAKVNAEKVEKIGVRDAQIIEHLKLREKAMGRLRALGADEEQLMAMKSEWEGAARSYLKAEKADKLSSIKVKMSEIKKARSALSSDIAKIDTALGGEKIDKAIDKLTSDAAKLTEQIERMRAEVGTGVVSRVIADAFGVFASTVGSAGPGNAVQGLAGGVYGSMAKRAIAWRAFRWIQPKMESFLKKAPAMKPGNVIKWTAKVAPRPYVRQMSRKDFKDIMENMRLDDFRYENVPGVSAPVGAALDAQRDAVKRHIIEKAPQPLSGRRNWSPSHRELSSFSRTLRAVSHGPDGVLADISEGKLDRESWDYLAMVDPEISQWLQLVSQSVAESGLASAEQTALISIILNDVEESNSTFDRVMRLQGLYGKEERQAQQDQINVAESAQTDVQGIEARASRG